LRPAPGVQPHIERTILTVASGKLTDHPNDFWQRGVGAALTAM